jgi:ribosome maturation factor RimP
MTAPALAERVREVVGPVAAAAGLHLEDVEVHRAGGRSIVRIVVDLAEEDSGSVDLDTIAVVSREISAALDEVDELEEEYTLEVSSPGASRPLTEPRHFRRARGRLVHVSLQDGRSLTGRLTDVQGDTLTILPEPVAATKGARPKSVPPVQVPMSEISHGQVEVELARALTMDLGPDDENDDENDDEHDDEEG